MDLADQFELKGPTEINLQYKEELKTVEPEQRTELYIRHGRTIRPAVGVSWWLALQRKIHQEYDIDFSDAFLQQFGS
jgi:hypothetical protein